MQIGFGSPRRLRTLIWARVVLATGVLLLGTGGIAFAAKQGHEPSKHGKAGHGSLSITHVPWGTANGKPVDLYTLRNGNGMLVKITNYGGVIQSIWVPDRAGALKNVALGFPKLSDYVNDFQNQPWPAAGGSGETYFGAIIGRYANRIANHSFTLDGTFYNLVGNNGPNNVNTLHGGPDSYNTQVWAATPETLAGAVALKLTYTDPSGKNGFPGAVTTEVTYTLSNDNALGIAYRATTTAPTVINYTNHTYFNLAGEGSGDVYAQKLAINSDTFQPTNSVQIPTGFASVAGTPFDFRTMKPIGRNIEDASARLGNQLVVAHGYDHNWVIRGSGYRLDAVAQDPGDGIVLWEYTDQPGVQLYTGNFLVGDLVGTSGHAYRQGDAFTLETQHYPDTPHHIGQAGWPSVVLNPGQVFNSKTTYKFTTAGPSFQHNF
ncbi:MAG TPA: aldose epimerase family protein [Solirubrobacteraceae bacterium]|nr:aldose epimerase family protein [Solirubrobacteraceae bacterium]